MSQVVVVDMDNTICNWSYPGFGDPKPGVAEALQEIKDMGYEVHILSCRTSHELRKHPIDRQEAAREMERFLKQHDIPYDRVLVEFKPVAHVYIDDRGIGFRDDWKKVVEELKEMN